ncbi:Hypothetical_protein [Hexamita inflata]|uniref:Hypothetical_protein n=1 Tax=Hexamita inflata TaxID=28002 RepID=A0ABP1J6V9_9EUKA
MYLLFIIGVVLQHHTNYYSESQHYHFKQFIKIHESIYKEVLRTSQNEQELCANFYKIALDNTEVLWSIDILFYNDKDFVSLESFKLKPPILTYSPAASTKSPSKKETKNCAHPSSAEKTSLHALSCSADRLTWCFKSTKKKIYSTKASTE